MAKRRARGRGELAAPLPVLRPATADWKRGSTCPNCTGQAGKPVPRENENGPRATPRGDRFGERTYLTFLNLAVVPSASLQTSSVAVSLVTSVVSALSPMTIFSTLPLSSYLNLNSFSIPPTVAVTTRVPF